MTVRAVPETTVTLSVEVKQELAEYQAQLRAEEGRTVAYNEVIQRLLAARRQLAAMLGAEQGE